MEMGEEYGLGVQKRRALKMTRLRTGEAGQKLSSGLLAEEEEVAGCLAAGRRLVWTVPGIQQER
jgi:hypothetical protein